MTDTSTSKTLDDKASTTDQKTTSPPSTTTTSNANNATTAAQKIVQRGGRWKQARIEEDPIIAPGYGRQSDLERLTNALNRDSAVQLPVSAVEALMKAKGRGIRSSARGAETPGRGTSAAAAAATPISSAWADFMKEEGVNLNPNGNDDTSSAAAAKKEDDESKPAASTSDMVAAAGESRTYKPFPWDSKTASPPSKKARGSDQEGGHLVQSGTLDASIVGRGKLSNADFSNHVYHLSLPTVLKLPTLITKVFSAGHSVHAIAIDSNGGVYGWGRNEGQQLGSHNPQNVYWPTRITDLDEPIVQAATGKSHTLFLTRDGAVYALGSNKFGQCGVKPGPASETVGTPRITVVPDGVEMAEVSFFKVRLRL